MCAILGDNNDNIGLKNYKHNTIVIVVSVSNIVDYKI